MVPDRHGATAWKHWIFCLTDHLDFENLENRRRYHNPGKPRTAGLCGREVVASDHLPLSSTFFGWPKPPALTHKTAALVPFPMLFSPLEIPSKNILAALRPHRPHTAHSLPSAPVCHPSAKASHSPSQAATIARFVPSLGSCPSALPHFLLIGDSLLRLQRCPGPPDPASGIVCTALLEIAYYLWYNIHPTRKITLKAYPSALCLPRRVSQPLPQGRGEKP